MAHRKKEIIKVLIYKTRKFPRRCRRISFEVIDDGSQYDVVTTLMSYMNLGRYSIITPSNKG